MDLTRVAVLDPHAIYRAGFEHVFKNHAWIKLVQSSGDPDEFLDWLKASKADLLITEIRFEKVDGNEFLKNLRQNYPGLRVIVSTLNAREPMVRRCMTSGCHGFITKDISKLELLEAIEDVVSGRFYISRVVNRQLIANITNGDNINADVKLTMRELQVLEMVCKELNSKEISMELQISEYTVANHRKSISKKLGVKNLAGMVKYALMNGVL